MQTLRMEQFAAFQSSSQLFRALCIVTFLGKPAYATRNSRNLAVTRVKLPSAMTHVWAIVQILHLDDSVTL